MYCGRGGQLVGEGVKIDVLRGGQLVGEGVKIDVLRGRGWGVTLGD